MTASEQPVPSGLLPTPREPAEPGPSEPRPGGTETADGVEGSAGSDLTADRERSGGVVTARRLKAPQPADRAPGALRPDERIAELDRRVRQLELLIWGGDGDDLAQLDLSDPELVGLAKAAEYAQTLTRMLVSPPVRAACEQAIETRYEWRRHYEFARDAALAASRTLATSRAGQDRHREAAREFEAARAQLGTLLPQRQRVMNAAQHARQQLAYDREIRDRYGQEITEGHRAWVSLTTRLRLRTAAAIERGEPLPIWLVGALGPPPSADSAPWRELAVQLFAYRLSYGVSDPEVPLGVEPTTQDSPRRRQWYRELERQLSSWSGRGG